MLRVFEAFAGYGSQSLALERLRKDFPDFNFEVVGISEIDKYAIHAYNALHPGITNYGDISKIDWSQVADFDLFTYSFPCTDISNAGKQEGFSEGSGTRSSLLWECRKAIIAKKPKYLLMENVKALMSNKFKPLLGKWMLELESYGYKNWIKVLNTKDFGVPQNRERCFLVSIHNENATFQFPEPFKLIKCLKDILEEGVDERYFLSDKAVQGFIAHAQRKQAEGCGFKFEPTDGEGIAKTIVTAEESRGYCNFIEVKEATKQGYAIAKEGDSINIALPNSKTRRGRVGHGIANTLDTGCQQAVIIKDGVKK